MEQNQLVIFCTCPDRESGEQLATAIVKDQMAACVNLVPRITSIYNWKGVLKREPECLLLIKTSADRFEALRQRLRETHPSEVPEIIALPICQSDPDYLAWLTESTRPG